MFLYGFSVNIIVYMRHFSWDAMFIFAYCFHICYRSVYNSYYWINVVFSLLLLFYFLLKLRKTGEVIRYIAVLKKTSLLSYVTTWHLCVDFDIVAMLANAKLKYCGTMYLLRYEISTLYKNICTQSLNQNAWYVTGSFWEALIDLSSAEGTDAFHSLSH